MKPRILVLGHYPLEQLDRAPKVRTYRMIEALAHYAWVTVITGTRSIRGPVLRKSLRLLDQVDAIYLESGSSTATVSDCWFLYQAHRHAIPLGIFVRDAYQLFPDLYPPAGIKGRILSLLYKITLGCYARWATIIFVPTAGLGQVVPGTRKALLPPGGIRAGGMVKPPRFAHRIIYVGAAGPHDGVEMLVAAFALVKEAVADAELWLVMRPTEVPGHIATAVGVQVLEASGVALETLLQSAQVAVIPRIDTRYNRLALPVKLMDYLSQGLPVVVTKGSEAANVVEQAHAGLVVEHTVTALAEGLAFLLQHTAERQQMSRNAVSFISENLWDDRAASVLATLLPDHPDGAKE
ncbi:MAG: glycosyl transferase family 1 [Sulfobacillus benefaciens]|uniref:Glycosyl transferase family 1 n=1 Tax=Sulfobacillus benefaciens TaxID=453960 RepID=A0A2T2XIT2_9FIRM|nr:MAG: glycosyl transferase family 1 [Sulfobacillus benefaciens]